MYLLFVTKVLEISKVEVEVERIDVISQLVTQAYSEKRHPTTNSSKSQYVMLRGGATHRQTGYISGWFLRHSTPRNFNYASVSTVTILI